jgi:hypothetical protein
VVSGNQLVGRGLAFTLQRSTDSGSTYDSFCLNTLLSMQLMDGSGNVLTPFFEDIVTSATSPIELRSYSTNKAGYVVTTPGVYLNVRGVMLNMVATGANLSAQLEIYQGTTLVATAANNPTVSSTHAIHIYQFSSVVSLTAGTAYRFVVSVVSAGGSSTNYLTVAPRVVIPNTSAAKAAKPFAGSMSVVYYDGATWTTTDTEWGSLWLVLEEGNEFGATDTNITASEIKSGVSHTINGSVINGTYDGSDLNSDPGVANVRSGTTYKIASATNNRTGTLDLPATSNVKTGVTFDGAGQTGTYTGSDRWTNPGESNVRQGTAYKADSTTNNKTGTAYIPAAADVRSGTNVDATTGTLDLPAEADVRDGTDFDGGSQTGTLDLPSTGDVKVGVIYDNATKVGAYDPTSRFTDPGEPNVRFGVQYKYDSTTNNKTGSYDEVPTVDEIATAVWGSSLALTVAKFLGLK